MATKKPKSRNNFWRDPYVVAALIAGLVFVSRIAINILSDAIVAPYASNATQVIVGRELMYVVHDTVLVVLGLLISIKAVLSRNDPIVHAASFVAVAIAFMSAWDLVEMFGQMVFSM